MTVRLYRPEPCLHLLQGNGECPSWHDEGCPHHDTVEQAVEEITNYVSDYDTEEWWAALELVIAPQEAPCWVVTCDDRAPHEQCEKVYENGDTGWRLHLDEKNESSIAADSDWVLAEHAGTTYAVCPQSRWRFDDHAESTEQAVLVHLRVIDRPEDWDPPPEPPGPNDVPLPYPQDPATLATLGERHGFTVTD